MSDEEVLNLDDEVAPPTSARKRVIQPTLAHLFRFKKTTTDAVQEGEGHVAKKSKQQPTKQKRKKDAVIESSEEEEEEGEAPQEEGGGKKKRKAREKKDLSNLKGPVDVARGTILSVMRGALESAGNVTKDASVVMGECARLFVHFLAARSDEIAREQGKSIVMPAAVIEAVKDLELDFVLGVLEDMLAAEAGKKQAAVKAKEQKKQVSASQAPTQVLPE